MKLGKDIFAGELKKTTEAVKTTEETSGVNYIRKTFIVSSKYADLLNRKAYWERRELKEILNEILEEYFKDKSIKAYPKQ